MGRRKGQKKDGRIQDDASKASFYYRIIHIGKKKSNYVQILLPYHKMPTTKVDKTL